MIRFTKMHGCGNDYVYINGADYPIEDKAELAIRVSNRHFGIGSDGVIFINPSTNADFEMEMYNADGTRAEMCGNGIRCVAKYVFDKGLTDKTQLLIESADSVKKIWLETQDGMVSNVKVNMGTPEFIPAKIPVIAKENTDCILEEEIEVQGIKYRFTAVSMGNPHAVVQMDDLDKLEIEKTGPLFEHHPRFPRRINTEFIKVDNRQHITMRVWERGTGETLACGTGACAVAAACMLNGLTDNKVTVKLLGGDLEIEWNQAENFVYMSGPATTVFDGEVTLG